MCDGERIHVELLVSLGAEWKGVRFADRRGGAPAKQDSSRARVCRNACSSVCLFSASINSLSIGVPDGLRQQKNSVVHI